MNKIWMILISIVVLLVVIIAGKITYTHLVRDPLDDSFPLESFRVYCGQEEPRVEVCAEIYQPVCASVNVECITEPCDPVQETFSNSCFACMNERVEWYLPWECAT